MKKHTNKIRLICLAIGVILILYPIISNYIYKLTQTMAITNYQSEVTSMKKKEKEELKNKYKKYNKAIFENTSSNVNLLNLGEIIGYIEIPKINVKLSIYEGTTTDILSKGVGHLENTSLIGEENTHCVLVAHTGLAKTKLFDDLDKLSLKDVFYITMLDNTYYYEVDQIKVVNPSDTEDLKVVENKEYVTLVTCTPRYINSQRLLVRGKRVKE